MRKQSKKPRRRTDIYPPPALEVPPPAHLWHLPVVKLDPETAAQLTGRSLRTVARWRATRIHDKACLTVLQTHAYGLLPGKKWREWHVTELGGLVPWMARRDSDVVYPGELAHRSLLYLNLADARNDIRQLRAEIAALIPAEPQQLTLRLAG